MNNKPVAWMALNQLNNTYSAFTDSDKERMLPHVQQLYANWIPLYTHPVKEQLTEEQVIDITKAFFNIHPETQLSEKFSIPLYELTHFARAIQRKAQEK